MLDAHRFYGPAAGFYVTLTALALAVPAMAYTGVRHAHPFKARYAKGRAAATLYARYALLVAAPLAATYRSELLGFAAVAIGYWLLGFSWACHGLCWCFGFDDERALAPFRTGASVFGCVVLFLALLIVSSKEYNRPSARAYRRRRQRQRERERERNNNNNNNNRRGRNVARAYPDAEDDADAQGGWLSRACARCGLNGPLWARSALMAGSLAAAFAFGTAFDLPGMANTAAVFAVFWLLYHYASFHVEAKWSGWVLVFVASLAAWRGALWLHTHPGFVAACFTQAAG